MAVSAWTKQELAIWPFGPTSANVVGRVLQVLDFINTLHRQIMSSSSVTQGFKDAWGGFYRVAANYLVVAQQHPIAMSTEDVQARIEAFATQALEWRRAFESAGGTPEGPAITPETPPESKAPWWLKWSAAGLGLLGAGYLGYLSYKSGIWQRISAKARARV
jgi:hypothetical protein